MNTIKRIQQQIIKYKEEVTEYNFLTLSSALIQEWEPYSDEPGKAFTENDLFVAYDLFKDGYIGDVQAVRLEIIARTTIGYANIIIQLLQDKEK